MKWLFLMLLALSVVTLSSPASAVDLTPLIKKIPRKGDTSNPVFARANNRNPDYTETVVETRPCEKEDVLDSMWKLVYSKEKPAGRHEKMSKLYKHQYLYLGIKDKFIRVRSNKSIDTQQEIERYMTYIYSDDSEGNGATAKTYKMQPNDKKMENIFYHEKLAVYRHNCSIIKKKKSIFEPGDMIFNGYTYGGKSMLYELFRRWY